MSKLRKKLWDDESYSNQTKTKRWANKNCQGSVIYPRFSIPRRNTQKKFNNTCFVCKRTSKQTQIVCHHIDFNEKNHQEENLILLCAKCHNTLHKSNNISDPILQKLKQGVMA